MSQYHTLPCESHVAETKRSQRFLRPFGQAPNAFRASPLSFAGGDRRTHRKAGYEKLRTQSIFVFRSLMTMKIMLDVEIPEAQQEKE